MINQAVILCGGKGVRLGDAIRFSPAFDIPKPLQEVGGKPFVKHSINMLKGIGFQDIVLLVGFKKEMFEFLEDDCVRLVETKDDVNKAILNIVNIDETFLLLNGDCFPVMDWRAFCDTVKPRIAMKIVERDAGVAIVSWDDIDSGRVDCSKILDMVPIYENYTILGGLHIGTIQGLQRARQFFDIVVHGQ